MYNCYLCGYRSDYKHNVAKHVRRMHGQFEKKKSVPLGSIDKPWRCDCGKLYKHQSGLSRHMKTCCNKGQSLNTPTLQINMGDNNVLSNVGNVYNQNLTIRITPFSLVEPKLTYEDFVEIMRGGITQAIMKLVNETHFNCEKPEGMNCYISNLKDKIGRVFEENGWEVCKSHELAFRVFEKYRESIECLLDEIQNEENAEDIRKRIGNLEKTVKAYASKWEDKIGREDLEKHSVDTIHLLLYNKKDLVRQTHNLRH